MGWEPIDAEIESQMDAIYSGVLDDYYKSDAYHEDIGRGIDEFIAERQKSYYLGHPSLIHPATRLLAEARELFDLQHYASAQVFAGAAAEIAFGDTLLKPMVYGLVHSDTVAPLVADVIENARSIYKFKALLVAIVSEFSQIDLTANSSELNNQSLWSFVDGVRKQRNSILHSDGFSKVSKEDAETAITASSQLLEQVLPKVLAGIGLHLHGGEVCGDSHGSNAS
jgi:hypothetical protein